jgi:hypothetical protein
LVGVTAESKHNEQYPNLRPVLYIEDLPVPRPPETWSVDEENEDV